MKHLRRSYSIGIVLLWLGLAQLSFAEPSLVRTNHGTTPYPVWSELTFFEREALGRLERARTGDPEALLGLYLIASNVRELSDYHQVKERIKGFISAFEEQAVGDDPRTQGELLNHAMHQHFFLREKQGHGPPGYLAEQSRLMGVFETGEYNCISSALLYAVLARELGLSVNGVILPTHAFIQLNLPDGAEVDVETTNASGFGQVHNEAYFRKLQATADSNSAIPPSTYQEYLNREITSALELAARNMLNQHTAAHLMTEEDISRLAEVAALIAPGYANAQQRKLHYYNREIQRLAAAGQWRTLERFFATTLDTTLSVAQRFPQHQELLEALLSYQQGAMLVYANAGEIDKTLGMIGRVMDYVTHNSAHRSAVEMRVSHAVGVLLDKLVQRAAFEDGLLVLSLVEGYLSQPRGWSEMLSWFYLRWSEVLWNEGDWEGVTDLLNDYFAAARSDIDKDIGDTLANAYHNWVLERLQTENMESARGVVAQCRARHSPDVYCEKADKTLRAASRRDR